MDDGERKARRRELGRQLGVFEKSFEAVLSKLSASPGGSVPQYCELTSWEPVDWSAFPPSATLQGANLPFDRVERKTLQIENMLLHAGRLISSLSEKNQNGLTVVDFCGGGGSLSIPLAVMYPEHTFIMVDSKPASVAIARDRCIKAGLTNLEILESQIEAFTADFDLGVALHACGSASDFVLKRCIHKRAAYVIASCCVGKILANRRTPLSGCLSLSEGDFCAMCKAADFGHSDLAAYNETDRRRRCCKSFVELDRQLFSEENGYFSKLYLMKGGGAKNDVLVGRPVSDAGEREQLEQTVRMVEQNYDRYLFD